MIGYATLGTNDLPKAVAEAVKELLGIGKTMAGRLLLYDALSTEFNISAVVFRLMIGALAGLMTIGVLFVYSATMVSESAQSAPWFDQSHFRHRWRPGCTYP